MTSFDRLRVIRHLLKHSAVQTSGTLIINKAQFLTFNGCKIKVNSLVLSLFVVDWLFRVLLGRFSSNLNEHMPLLSALT